MESSKILPKYFQLNNGLQIPSIGYGTYAQEFKYSNLKESVIQAVNLGYRHIDTADLYQNYKELKEAFEEIFKTVKREELFITTKILNNSKTIAEDDIKNALAEMGLSYLDLVLIHWPYGPHPIHVIWKNLEKCVELGYTKSIGVSNFKVQTIQDILTYCKVKPVCNQIEYHVYLQQDSYLQLLCLYYYTKIWQTIVKTFTPLCKGGLRSVKEELVNPFEDPILVELGKKYKKSVAQVMLCWIRKKGIIPIPKSTRFENLKNNFDCYFEMDDQDIKRINNLNQNLRIGDPSQYEFAGYLDIFA